MAITVTTDDEKLINELNDGRMASLPRALRLAVWTFGLLLVFAAGIVAQNQLGGWWTQRKLDRINLDAMVVILQYNLQQGKLAMPPQLQAAPPPATVPAPAPTPKAEAPPAKK